jgi:hypothetical protein
MGIKRDKQSARYLGDKYLGQKVIVTVGGGCRKGTVKQVSEGHVAGKYDDGTCFYVKSKHVCIEAA